MVPDDGPPAEPESSVDEAAARAFGAAEFYRAMIDATGEAVVAVDEAGEIVFANPAVERVFGHESAELVGESVGLLFPEGLREAHRAAMAPEFGGGEPGLDRDAVDLPGLHADGREMDLAVAFRSVERDGERLFVGVVRDGTNVIDESNRTDESDRTERAGGRALGRDELADLERINVVLRDVNRAVVAATSRAEIERAVCDRLVDADAYRFAWIGVPRGQAGELVPSQWAGGDEGYLSAITVTTDESATGRGPAGRAYRTGRVQFAGDLLADPTCEPWREAAAARGFRASVGIPIRYRETVYGVLNLYTDREDGFAEREVEVLDELGETVGHAINAVESRQLLHADTVIELEFHSTDDASFFTQVSAELGCTVTLEGVVPVGENTYLFYVGVEGAPGESLVELAEGFETIRDASVVGDDGPASLVLLEVAGSSNVVTLIEAGAHVRSAVAEAGESSLVAEVAPDADVGNVVDAVGRVFPEAKLVGRREVERPVQTAWAFREAVKSRLTDRQLAVLEAALRGGYFARPRDVSGSELAESFGITPSTFHHHLQTGLRKVVAAVFDEEGES